MGTFLVRDTAHVASTGVFLLGADQACALQSNGMRAPTFGVTMTVGSLLPTVWHARCHASSQVGTAFAPTIEAASTLFGPQKMIRLARLKRNAFS